MSSYLAALLRQAGMAVVPSAPSPRAIVPRSPRAVLPPSPRVAVPAVSSPCTVATVVHTADTAVSRDIPSVPSENVAPVDTRIAATHVKTEPVDPVPASVVD